LLMPVLALFALYLILRRQLDRHRWFLRLLLWAMFLPYLANTAGWILTEVGRQPWIVFSLMRIENAVSPNVGSGTLLFSLLAFAALYGGLMGADLYLLAKHARQGIAVAAE
jgi:cytochrome d ubiquinol oxidase subunit I